MCMSSYFLTCYYSGIASVEDDKIPIAKVHKNSHLNKQYISSEALIIIVHFAVTLFA